MLKKPLILVALCLCLLFAPALAQAAPWQASRSGPSLTAPRILSVLAGWWSFLLGGEETGGTAIQEKNGCGIDPNGQPLCGEGGPADGVTTDEDPATEG